MTRVTFNSKQKSMSRSSLSSLNKRYEDSEKRLERAARKGDRNALNHAMSVHHDLEYAILYKHVANSKKKK